MPTTTGRKPTTSLPNPLLTFDAIENLVADLGLSHVQLKLIEQLCGAICQKARTGVNDLCIALNYMPDEDDFINLHQLEVVLNSDQLLRRVNANEHTTQACRELIKRLRLVWLDRETIEYYVEQMGLQPETADRVVRVAVKIGRKLHRSADKQLSALRAQLGKPPRCDSDGDIVINHKMLAEILREPGQILISKIFRPQRSSAMQQDLQSTRGFVDRLETLIT